MNGNIWCTPAESFREAPTYLSGLEKKAMWCAIINKLLLLMVSTTNCHFGFIVSLKIERATL